VVIYFLLAPIVMVAGAVRGLCTFVIQTVEAIEERV